MAYDFGFGVNLCSRCHLWVRNICVTYYHTLHMLLLCPIRLYLYMYVPSVHVYNILIVYSMYSPMTDDAIACIAQGDELLRCAFLLERVPSPAECALVMYFWIVVDRPTDGDRKSRRRQSALFQRALARLRGKFLMGSRQAIQSRSPRWHFRDTCINGGGCGGRRSISVDCDNSARCQSKRRMLEAFSGWKLLSRRTMHGLTQVTIC